MKLPQMQWLILPKGAYVSVTKQLIQAGYDVYVTGFSALDRYYRKKTPGVVEIATNADLIALSGMFDSIEFPPSDSADALISEGSQWYVIASLPDDDAYHPFSQLRELQGMRTCQDDESGNRKDMHDQRLYGSLRHTSFWFDCRRGIFRDPESIYWDLRRPDVLALPPDAELERNWWSVAADAAVLTAGYGFLLSDRDRKRLSRQNNRADGNIRLQHSPLLSSFDQKLLLMRLGSSQRPEIGMDLLMETGFVDAHWPLLAGYRGVEQDKEFHPEGDVWDHTLETFRYIKKPDPLLFMALLLHDCGKPFSSPEGKRFFNQHAQIGAAETRKFMKNLDFDDAFTDKAAFLVREHMLPAHISALPAYRTEKVMDSPLFPLLLELYRCDISSSFRGPDGYYAACKAYKQYKRFKKSPYRNSDGKLAPAAGSRYDINTGYK